jgi:DNA-3-methyladenine glycosylase II
VVGGRIETADDLVQGARILCQKEPRFAPVLEAVGPLPLRRRPDGFGALVSAIVGQQISTAAAGAILARVQAAGLDTAPSLRAASDESLAACGLSRPKRYYLRALAQADLDYAALRQAPLDTVVRRLVAQPGIGRWTAEIYAKFALGHWDVFAAGDLALQEATRRLFELPRRPAEAQMRQIAAQWSPVRAVAARALWAYYRLETDREGSL